MTQHGKEEERGGGGRKSLKLDVAWLFGQGARLSFVNGRFADGAPDELDRERTTLGYATGTWEYLCVPCYQQIGRPAISRRLLPWLRISLARALALPWELQLACDHCQGVFWDRRQAVVVPLP